MIVYIYNIGVDLYNGFNGLRHRINWTYFTVLDGLAHPLYSHSKMTLDWLVYALGVVAVVFLVGMFFKYKKYNRYADKFEDTYPDAK